MLLGNSYNVTFNLKSDFYGDATPIVYGSIDELGNGDPNKGVELAKVDGIYNYKADVIFPHPIDANEVWYSYCYRPAFGAIIPESVPRRIIPKLEASAEIFDTIDKVTSISDLVIHFHVRCPTEFGQQLYLSGNLTQLGEWDPDSAIQLFYEGNCDYWTCHVRFPLSAKSRKIEYKYFRSYSGSKTEWEPSITHKLGLGAVTSPAAIEIEDTFRCQNESLKALTSSPFVDVINKRGLYFFNITGDQNSSKNENEFSPAKKPGKIYPNEAKPGQVNLRFNVFCPNLRKNQKLMLIGSCNELGGWKLEKAVEMNDYYFPLWVYDITMSRSSFPFEYKYVIVSDEDIDENEEEEKNETKNKEMKEKIKNEPKSSKIHKKTFWEPNPNRNCPKITSNMINDYYPVTYIVSNWFANPNPDPYKGFGISCPLFSLRSDDSCGIGQYTDLKGLADICNEIGSSLIRILPVNDTTNKGDWDDSNPYRYISCFALHPIYINLLQIVDQLPKEIYNDIQSTKWNFEQKTVLDYPTVYEYKMKTLRRIYDIVIKDNLNDNLEFSRFVDQELEWLRPYALFSLFRDRYGTSNYHSWPNHSTITRREINSQCAKHEEELKFIYWIQFICDKQFKDARSYCSEHGVVLQGDFPLGINYNSVETWTWPNYFRLQMSSGSPPDENFTDGQNWGFPTYDWEAMEEDNFHWLELRLRRTSDLFQFLSIDHVLEFFRAWEIPRDSYIRGILGHFNPCNTIDKADLEARGLFDLERYLHPYVRYHLLQQYFAEDADRIARQFFTPKNYDRRDDYFAFKPEFNTEIKIEKEIEKFIHLDSRKRNHYKKSLFELLANVLLIPDPDHPGCYHVRSKLTHTTSWIELQEPSRLRIKELYEYFTLQRQNDIWQSNANIKFDFLNHVNNTLICAEDFDQKTEHIIKNIKKEGFLSFHVQRIPQEKNQLFDDISKCGYMSVCTPSTHNMMPIREWWEDENDRSKIKEFFKTQINQNSQPPYTCEIWVLESIIKQYFLSDSMWAVFLLQDLTDLILNLRRQAPKDERINDPSDFSHHWRYRYPFSLSELKSCQEFISKIRDLAEKSHRI